MKKRQCQFCQGATGSRQTEEHIWPAWAAHLLPKRQKKREYLHIGENGFDHITEIRREYSRQGSPSGYTVRGICKVCNGGWMSALENAAKPLLYSIVFGDSSYLSPKAVDTVSRWCFLKFCTVSILTSDIPCVTQDELNSLRSDGQISKRFSVWIYKNGSDDWRDRNAWYSSRVRTPEFQPSMAEPHNVNTFTLGFGQIIFFMILQWGVRIDPSVTGAAGAKLWRPRPGRKLHLPKEPLNVLAADDLATCLPRAVGSGKNFPPGE